MTSWEVGLMFIALIAVFLFGLCILTFVLNLILNAAISDFYRLFDQLIDNGKI